MGKPADIPQDIWDEAASCVDGATFGLPRIVQNYRTALRKDFARAILAERERCTSNPPMTHKPTSADEWALVPREPDDAMITAGLAALQESLGHTAVIDRDPLFAYRAMLAAAPPSPSQGEVTAHPDDVAVDAFAAAMKAKLKWEREEKGRYGWSDVDVCSDHYLAQQLIEHLAKGNDGTFEDIANFAMMLHQRGAAPDILANIALTASQARVEALTDEIEAEIYGRHERGFVMRPLIDPPSVVDAVRALKANRDEALAAYGALIVAIVQAGLGLRDKTPEEIAAGADDLCHLKIVNRPAEALSTRLQEAVTALEQGFMTANSDGQNGRYEVVIKFRDLASMQDGHGTLVNLSKGATK